MIDAVSEPQEPQGSNVYLDSKTAAQYMAFRTVKAFRSWARRMRIKAMRRAPGRVLLFRRSDLDATLTEEPWAPGQDGVPTAPALPPPRRRRGRVSRRPQ